MLAKKYKLKDPRVIFSVRKNGEKIQSADLGVFYLKREDGGVSRFAFVISKKISKLSVERNRINRALNEGVRESFAKIPSGFDFVFLVKRGIVNKKNDEIIQEVEKLFQKIKTDA